MGHVRGGWTEEGAGAKKWVTITTCWIRAPDADPVCHLIDKSSIFCIKSSQLYVSVAPVTVSDNSIYLSHIMPRHFLTLQIFHSDFHILIPNNFHGGSLPRKSSQNKLKLALFYPARPSPLSVTFLSRFILGENENTDIIQGVLFN